MSTDARFSDFATRAIHAGQDADPTTGAVIPPLYQSTTYKQDGVGGFRNGYEYTRGTNPTRTALETQLAALEGGDRGFSFASGLAAEDALLRSILKPGDHVLMGNDVYGGTHRLVNRLVVPWGLELSTAEMTDLDAVRAAIRPNTRVLWLETPSNPLMKVSDIAALVEIGHAAGAVVVVDNTFASPYLQQPLALGADVVVHSTTKYIGGHSDVLGGAVILNSGLEVQGEDLADRIGFTQFAAGAVSGPMDAWLTTRGLKTLHLRMERHSDNAQTIAEALVGHAKLDAVYYPGLPEHPGHELAARQMRRFGGMISLQLKDAASAVTFVESTELFTLAESLGGVESLVCYPSEMTHASVRGTALEVSPAVVRLSVGIEGVDDLLADVLETLDRV
ncbi:MULTISPECIES: cystathionine gamma-synthase [unclassified Salinibacterium]|uniref:cystathionine gamma-synthase n=1 Tax=unclassified Salinibacterium TaxID=2632331 RepID=UPI00141F0D16|nr:MULTISPECIES: cystathionine gamma-synthase [unclassified Salinibacterium]